MTRESCKHIDEPIHHRKLWYLSFFALICYLVINTGIVSDDFSYTISLKGRSFADLFFFGVHCFSTPLENFTHFIWYHFFRLDNLIVNNFIRA